MSDRNIPDDCVALGHLNQFLESRQKMTKMKLDQVDRVSGCTGIANTLRGCGERVDSSRVESSRVDLSQAGSIVLLHGVDQSLSLSHAALIAHRSLIYRLSERGAGVERNNERERE